MDDQTSAGLCLACPATVSSVKGNCRAGHGGKGDDSILLGDEDFGELSQRRDVVRVAADDCAVKPGRRLVFSDDPDVAALLELCDEIVKNGPLLKHVSINRTSPHKEEDDLRA